MLQACTLRLRLSPIQTLSERWMQLPINQISGDARDTLARRSPTTSSSSQGNDDDAAELIFSAVKVLGRRGEWRRCLAALQPMHHHYRQRAAHIATTERWTIPEDVHARWRATRSSSASSTASVVPRATLGRDDAALVRLLSASSTADVVARAFDLQRHSTKDGSTATTLRHLTEELIRRREMRSVVQCLSNWSKRGLCASWPTSSPQIDSTSSSSSSSSSMMHHSPWDLLIKRLFPVAKGDALRHALPPSATVWVLQRDLLDASPIIFASCITTPSTAEWISAADPAWAMTVVRTLLAYCATTCGSVAQQGVRRMEQERMMWRACAHLLRALRPHLMRSTKTNQEELLVGILRAVQTSSLTHVTSDAQSTVLANAMREGMRGCVESVCSAIVRVEARARFIGLPTFSSLAAALSSVDAAPTNAMLQALLLCLSQPPPQNLIPSPSSSSSSSQSISTASFVATSPSTRWLAALHLLRDAHHARACRITSAHLRCLLSGLQSISIRRTWMDALRCTTTLTATYNIVPDELSKTKLLLNMQQSSWQRALDIIPLHHHFQRRPSISLLRDVHLIAAKHAPWSTSLAIMEMLVKAGKDANPPQTPGRVNMLYALYASAASGMADLCLHHVHHTLGVMRNLEEADHDPRDGLIVLVAVVGMMDHGHVEAMACVARTLRSSSSSSSPPPPNDVLVASYAAELLAHHLGTSMSPNGPTRWWDPQDVRATLHAAGEVLQELPPSMLAEVLHTCITLASCQGLQHLHAPVRLVFDVFGPRGGYQHLMRHEHNYESRQRATAAQRPALFVPHRHRLQHARRFAAWLGRVGAVMDEASDVVRQEMAESMRRADVGPEYLNASFS